MGSVKNIKQKQYNSSLDVVQEDQAHKTHASGDKGVNNQCNVTHKQLLTLAAAKSRGMAADVSHAAEGLSSLQCVNRFGTPPIC